MLETIIGVINYFVWVDAEDLITSSECYYYYFTKVIFYVIFK